MTKKEIPIKSEDEKASKHKKGFLKRIITLRNLNILLLAYLLLSIYQIKSDLNPGLDQNASIIDGLNQAKEFNQQLAQNLNATRKYLLLEENTYDQFSNETAPADTTAEEAILSFIGYVGNKAEKEEEIQAMHSKLQDAVNSEDFKTLLSEQGLGFHTFYPSYDGSDEYLMLGLKTESDGPIAYIRGDIKTQNFTLHNDGDKTSLGKEPKEKLTKVIPQRKEKWIANKKMATEMMKNVKDFIKSSKVTSFLKDKQMTASIDEVQESDDSYYYQLKGKHGETIDLGVKKGDIEYFSHNGDEASYKDEHQFQEHTLALIREIDNRTEEEKLLATRKEELKNIIENKSFQDFIKSLQLAISTEPQDESDRLVYTLKKGEEEIAKIILEKGTGLIKVQSKDDKFAVNVFDYDSSTNKKKA